MQIKTKEHIKKIENSRKPVVYGYFFALFHELGVEKNNKVG